MGKSLPTAYHWVQAAAPDLGAYIAPLSNIAGNGVIPVGSRPGVSPFGAFDVAGNVREWVWNELTPDRTRVLLGGAWTDPAYYFQEVVARSPFDRAATNGFRLVQYSDSQAVADTLTGPIPPASRDYSKETPVSDEVFRAYQNLSAYDPQPLDAKVESIDGSAKQWVKEKVSFAAAYDRERVPAYLFLPRNIRPPYQTVVYFPGASAMFSLTSDELPTNTFDFLMLSGRAVLYPVYKGTYERRIVDQVMTTTSRADAAGIRDLEGRIGKPLATPYSLPIPNRLASLQALKGEPLDLHSATDVETGYTKSKLAGGQAAESIHTLVDRRMSREIAVQAERVRTPIERAQALKHADRAGRVEAGSAHEQDAQFVRFEFFILRISAL